MLLLNTERVTTTHKVVCLFEAYFYLIIWKIALFK